MIGLLRKNASKGVPCSWLFVTFARDRGGYSVKAYEKKTRRYVHLVLENVGSIQIRRKDCIMALTSWAAVVISVSKVSYGLQVGCLALHSTL